MSESGQEDCSKQGRSRERLTSGKFGMVAAFFAGIAPIIFCHIVELV
jgi:hypothetical protein